MKSIGFLIAGLCLGLVVNFFYLQSGSKVKAGDKKLTKESFVCEEMAAKANLFLQDGDVVLSEALWQAALGSASRKPESLLVIWNKYKDVLEHSPKLMLSEQEKLARAMSFSSQFVNVLGGCDDEESLNSALGVYGDLNHYCEEKAKLVSANVSGKLSEIQEGKMNTKSPAEKIKKIAEVLLDINDDTKLIAVASRNSDVALVLKEALEKVPLTFGIAENEIKEMSAKLDQLREADSKNLAEPSPDGQGPCQLIFDSLDKIDASLGELSSSGLAETAAFAEKLQSLRVQSQGLKKKIYQTQVIRYNLWAVSVLTSLTKDADVAGTLAAIDQSLLHNSVSSIFSITYDGFIRAENNAQLKYENVGRILKDKKKTLSNF